LANLLLRNDGGGRFTDVTAEAGLADLPAGIGGAVAGFDNDDFRGGFVTLIDGVPPFLHTGRGTFTHVTKAPGLDQVGGVCLWAGWVDLDQDCDLDAIIGRLADTIAGALDVLRGRPASGGRVEVFINRGDAEPVPEGHRQPPLTVSFLRATEPKSLLE